MYYSEEELNRIQGASLVSELPNTIIGDQAFQTLNKIEIPDHIKQSVVSDDLGFRKFQTGNFWQKISKFNRVTEDEFLTTRFQNSHTVTSTKKLREYLGDGVSNEFLREVESGVSNATMNLKITPYILSLINWDNPYHDPLRKQFIPVESEMLEDHPMLTLDSLSEQADSPVKGLVHRYFDRVLFLPLDVCPVYCSFCTRSYAIGNDTQTVNKVNFRPFIKSWNKALAYIASRPEIEDVVISGGDTFMLGADRLRSISNILLAIPHVRRLRFATKGPAVMPMKILSDERWTRVIMEAVEKGRKMGKEVALHTHFNSPNEITDITRRAMGHLFRNGVKVRNQSVLIRGVNDDIETMLHLVRKLSFMNVQPYYVYQHDMVKGTEVLRTSVAESQEVEKQLRGRTAGFNTPLFVTDAPGGGGKRDLHSYEYYDRITGISVYRSPGVDSSKPYLYFDPVHTLTEEGKKLWEDQSIHEDLIRNAIISSGF